MTNDEIDPIVPVMPRQMSTDVVLADGGRRTYGRADAEAPLVPQV